MRQSGETMTSVSAGHIILTPTQPVRERAATAGIERGPLTKSRALYRLEVTAAMPMTEVLKEVAVAMFMTDVVKEVTVAMFMT